MITTRLAALLCAAMVAGCAGTPFSFDSARQVRVGMTEAQLTGIMGRPYSVTTRGDQQIWVWSEASAFGGARSVSFVLRGGKVEGVPTIPASF